MKVGTRGVGGGDLDVMDRGLLASDHQQGTFTQSHARQHTCEHIHVHQMWTCRKAKTVNLVCVCVCVCVCLSARAVSQGTQMYMHVLCAALCVRLHIACSLPAETERSVPKWARLLHDSRDDLCTKGKWIDLEGDAISI